MKRSHLIACALLGASVLLGVSVGVLAKELYRWTDENGVTHYSDSKPEGVDFERRAVITDPKPTATAATADAADASAAAKPPVKPTGPTPDCLQARSNLAVLNGAGDVSMDLNGDGTPETLDAAGRQTAIARHLELVKQHCG